MSIIRCFRYLLLFGAVLMLCFAAMGSYDRVSGEIYSVLTENNAPDADFTFTEDGLCADLPVEFTNLSTGDTLSYVWNFGDGKTSTAKDPKHKFTLLPGVGSQTFNVKLTVTTKSGLSDEVTKPVSVKRAPGTQITSDQGSTTFDNKTFFLTCEFNSSQYTFYNASSTKASNTKYTIDWGHGDIFEGEAWESFTKTFPLGITTVTYTVTGPECSTTEQFNIFVGTNPAVGLENPGNTNICRGDALTFPITGTQNNPPGTTYTVDFSDGTPPLQFNHPPPAEVTHIFDTNSCGSSGNAFSVTIAARNPCAPSFATVSPVFVSEIPEPIIEVADEPFCVDTSVPITNKTVYGTEVSTGGNCSTVGKFVWEISPATGWTLPTGSLGTMPNPNSFSSWTSGSVTINPVFSEPGTYTIKLTNGARCGNSETVETICVIPKPVPDFELETLEGCGPLEVRATNLSNVIDQCDVKLFKWSATYQQASCGTTMDWEFVQGTDEKTTDPVFRFNNPGEYTVELTYTTSCGVFKDSKKVNVTAPPAVTLQDIDPLCGPGTISPLASVVSCSTDEPVYKWTFEGGMPATFDGEIPGEVIFESVGNKLISLEVSNSCGSTTVTQTLVISEIPVIDLGEDRTICQGETISLSSALPSENYLYQWRSVPASAIPNAASNQIEVKPDQDISYILKVTDKESNCFIEEEIRVTVTPAPVITFDRADQTICSGTTSIPVAVSTNSGESTIEWLSEANGAIGVTPNGSTLIPAETLFNRTGQPITVSYIADIISSEQGSCAFVKAVYTITVLPEPVIANQSIEICNGDEAIFALTNTQFSWTVTEANGVEGATEHTGGFMNFSQRLFNRGSSPLDIKYQITPVSYGCLGDPFELVVTVLPSPNILFSLPDQTICSANMTEPVMLSSDVEGVTFTWESIPNGALGVIPSGEGTVIPSQNITNPLTTAIEVEYRVFAVSNTGTACSGTPTVYKVKVNPSLAIEAVQKDYSGYGISCHGADDGEITLNLSGGSGNYELRWTGPNGFTSSALELRNLKPGIYQLTVEDEFECDLNRTFEITEPAPLEASVMSTIDLICKGQATGEIALEVRGGVEAQNYIFQWTRNGQATDYNTSTISGILAGNYQVTVSDANRCSVTIDNIIITEPAQELVLEVDKGDISCYNANDGYIHISVSGGVAPYTINWNFGSSLLKFDDMGPGTYTVTLRDQLGCTIVRPITVADAPIFRVDPEVKQISCFGAKDAFIKLNLVGGVGNVTIRWDDGAEVESRFNLPEGNYGVTITDEDGCQIRREFIIVEPAQLVTEASVTDALDCNNPQSGEIILNVSGGTLPYTFKWSNGQTDQSLTGATAGKYVVEVTDANGCSLQRQFEIKRPAPLTIAAVRETVISCEPRKIEEIVRISVSGGVAPYQISWSGGEISANQLQMNTIQSGLYSVTVIDGNGCQQRETFDIINSDVMVDVSISSTAFELYQSFLVNMDIQFFNRSIGAISSYYWDFGDGTISFDENPTHKYQSEGEYTVTLIVTDVFGCSHETKRVLKVIDYFLVVPNIFTPNGDGVNDYFFPKFINISSLEFWVLNKWGETVFFTNEMNGPGWDGTIHGEPATPGNYVYRLKYVTVDGRVFNKTDVFMLLK